MTTTSSPPVRLRKDQQQRQTQPGPPSSRAPWLRIEILAPDMEGGTRWVREGGPSGLEVEADCFLAWLAANGADCQERIVIYAESRQARKLGCLVFAKPFPTTLEAALQRMEPLGKVLPTLAVWKKGRWLGLAPSPPRLLPPASTPSGATLLESPNGKPWLSLIQPNYRMELRVLHFLLDLGLVTPFAFLGRVHLVPAAPEAKQISAIALQGLATRIELQLANGKWHRGGRSEEHTSELQSPYVISY